MPHLSSLTLSECGVTEADTLRAAAGQLTALTSLQLFGNFIPAAVLASLPALHDLSMYSVDCGMGGACPWTFPEGPFLTSLTYLDLGDCAVSSLAAIWPRAGALRELFLEGCAWLQARGASSPTPPLHLPACARLACLVTVSTVGVLVAV